MPKRTRKRARPMRPRDRYRPAPIPGLLLHFTILLLNLIVRTAEDLDKNTLSRYTYARCGSWTRQSSARRE